MEPTDWEWKANKFGEWGYNCKHKPLGTGTTHSNRRQKRQHLQWDKLVPQDHPASSSCLEKHAEALEKALEKAKEKLETAKSLEKDKGIEEDEYTYSYSSSSSSANYRGRRRTRKPRSKSNKRSLEKDQAPSLEEDEDKGSLSKRRGRVAKNGAKEVLMEKGVEEDKALGKAIKEEPPLQAGEVKLVPAPGQGSLEKDQKEKPLTEGLPLEQKFLAAEEPLDKGQSEGVKLVPAPGQGSLEKDHSQGIKLTPAKAKPTVVVDWHNTVEVNNRVPPQNAAALAKLMDHAHVHILSYVETTKRQHTFYKQVRQLLPSLWRGLELHTCWDRLGPADGKAAWCKYLQAEAIIDDNNEIIIECLDEGLKVFAVVSRHYQHNNLPVRMIFDDFAEAVESYLENV